MVQVEGLEDLKTGIGWGTLACSILITCMTVRACIHNICAQYTLDAYEA